MARNPTTSGNALYFMPDISGFSSFVAQTEIEHSKHIIQELLQLLLDQNDLGLTLIEIEGDALFFFSEDLHNYEKLEAQISQMLVEFHTHLSKYDHQRICNCGACTSATGLKLKFIIHVGELHFIRVSGRDKPYGHDVNLIHRLTKNDVPYDQYMLLSEAAYQTYEAPGLNDFRGATITYDLGTTDYRFKELPIPKIPKIPEVEDIERFQKDRSPADLSVERVIRCSGPVLFELVSNLEKRKLWDELPILKFEPDRVNRLGTVHHCIVGSQTLTFNTGKAEMDPSLGTVYTENTKDLPFVKNYKYYLLIQPISEEECHVQVLNYFEANLIGKILLSAFMKRKLRASWEERLLKLSELCEKEVLSS